MADNGSKPLEGMSALVTGGGGGIGGASGAWLARDGAAVVLMGRTKESLVRDLRRHPGPGGPPRAGRLHRR